MTAEGIFGERALLVNDYYWQREEDKRLGLNTTRRPPPATTTTTQSPWGEGADGCSGYIKQIRFTTGPKFPRITYHSTVVKLDKMEWELVVEDPLMRYPLYKAYKASSIIKVEVKQCSNSNVQFHSFSILAKGPSYL